MWRVSLITWLVASFPGLSHFSSSDVTHMMNETRPSPFSHSSTLCIVLNANRRTKTGEAWERGYLACARISNMCFLLLVLLLLSWFIRWADFFAFFSQSCQPSAAFSIGLCTWLRKIRTLRRASRAVLPFLRRQETLSRCRRVMHLPGCERRLSMTANWHS